VFSESRKGQWIAVIETEKVMEAKQLKTQATGQLKPTALR
jgi:hypothetical protein